MTKVLNEIPLSKASLKFKKISQATRKGHLPLSVAFFACFATSATMAQTVSQIPESEYCTPYQLLNQAPINAGQVLFPYDLRVEEINGRKEVTIYATNLVVTEKQLGTLLRSPALADSRISKLRIDAREVIFEQSFSLDGGNLEVVADSIIFREGAAISLRPVTTSKLRLSARKIAFPAEVFGHFDIHQRDGVGDPITGIDDFSDIATLLDISVETLTFGGVPTTMAGLRDSLQVRFTLDGLVDFKSKILATLGANSLAVIEQENKKARWPELTILGWAQVFKIAPFAERLRAEIEADIRRDDVYLASLLSESSRFTLAMIQNAISRRTDLRGDGPAFAPVAPLVSYRSKVAEYAAGGVGAQRMLALLDLMKDLADKKPSLPFQKLDEIAKEVDTLFQNMGRDDNEIALISARIQNLGTLSDQLQQQYRARVAVLKANAAAIQASQRDRAQIVSLLSTATAIATTAYTANPQAGAAAGGLVYAIGNASSGRTALESINQGVKFAQDIKGPLESTKKGLDELTAARDKYKAFVRPGSTFTNLTIEESITLNGALVKKDDALKDFGGKLKGFGDSIGGLIAVYELFNKVTDEGSTELEVDDGLRKTGEDLSKVLADIKTEAQTLELIQRRLLDEQSQFIKLSEQAATFKKIDLTNADDQRRLGELLASSIKDELMVFADTATILFAHHQLEFGVALDVNPRALIDLTLAQEFKSQLFDAGAVASDKDALLQMYAVGKQRLAEISTLAGLMTSRSEKRVKDYVQIRGQAPIPFAPDQEINSFDHSPQAERTFVRTINKLLSEQYNVLRSGATEAEKRSRLVELSRRRIQIPFNIADRVAVQSYPQRLLQVAIKDVKSPALLNTGIDFFVDVERAGNLRTERTIAGTKVPSCVYVDLRDKLTPEDSRYRVFATTIGEIVSGNAFVQTKPSFWWLTPDTPPTSSVLVTYHPAEARAYLRLRLDSNAAWVSAPQISGMTFKYEIFQ